MTLPMNLRGRPQLSYPRKRACKFDPGEEPEVVIWNQFWIVGGFRSQLLSGGVRKISEAQRGSPELLRCKIRIFGPGVFVVFLKRMLHGRFEIAIARNREERALKGKVAWVAANVIFDAGALPGRLLPPLLDLFGFLPYDF